MLSISDATLLMMQYAFLKYGDIFKKYVLLSPNCVPLYNFDIIYNEFNKDNKSWIQCTSDDYIGKYTPIKYYNGTTNNGGTVWSIVSSVGTRYKLTILSDLMLDLRLQYYFSNWVDGLNPDPTIYKENRANDWNVWLNFGYIYYLQ